MTDHDWFREQYCMQGDGIGLSVIWADLEFYNKVKYT